LHRHANCFIITSMDEATLKQIVPRLGQTLKVYREKTGQNLSVIASKAGISISMLSQIERGVVSPSIDTLVMVCYALGLEPSDLFKALSFDRPVRVLHKSERLRMTMNGVLYEQLITGLHAGYRAELFLLEVKPDSQTTLSGEGHEGAEMGYVLDGKAILIVDGKEYELCEGDSVFFNSNQPHRLKNNGNDCFRAVWSISPPHVDYLKSSDE
jgi:transcriptional regulator with XRE-family HTH domain